MTAPVPKSPNRAKLDLEDNRHNLAGKVLANLQQLTPYEAQRRLGRKYHPAKLRELIELFTPVDGKQGIAGPPPSPERRRPELHDRVTLKQIG